MQKHIKINCIIKQVKAPSSKSVAQRFILASALNNTKITLNNTGSCDDVIFIKQVAKQLGADVLTEKNKTIITPNKSDIKSYLNCGESGLGLRLTTTIASTFNTNFVITGEGSLLKRPHKQFCDFLPKMGVDVTLTNNGLPLKINGILKGGNFIIDGSLSSQYISGLLMALPICKDDSTLKVLAPTSTPYIDLTINVLNDFGITIKNKNYNQFIIPGDQKYKSKSNTFTIEGDWSGAAFWIVYGLIKGEISISNLKKDSAQADIAILNIIKQVNGNYIWLNKDILKVTSKTLIPFRFDCTNCPDLFPSLVVLAASINGTSTIKGVNRLIHKESNRAIVLQTEFKKLGLKIKINNDLMLIYGTKTLKTSIINSNNDHRIAMAAAIASVLTSKGITIMDYNCVNKSYPEFWDMF